MKRTAVALIAILALDLALQPAACAFAQAAGPFPEIPVEAKSRHPHIAAHLAIVTGAALIGGSFVFQRQADRRYDDYLAATDPDQIERLYDDTVHADRLSSASLLTGEVLLAAGLYLRFLRRGSASPIAFDLAPDRCALSLRF